MKLSEDQIRRRLEKHLAALLRTFALVRDGRISVSEERRRNRDADHEYRAIRKWINKFCAIERAKNMPAKIKEPEKAPLPKGPTKPLDGGKIQGR